MDADADADGAAQYLTTGEAGRILGVSSARVRQLVTAGQLPARRTVGGTHFIELADVLAVKALRVDRKAELRSARAAR